MEKTANLFKKGKFAIVALFLLLSVVSVLLIGTVRINYNISDYLDDSTDTKISLGIMEEQFGLISNIQVMVKDVTPDQAEDIKDSLKAIENVVFVNFNSQNANYYKDGDALFVVLVDGNEYSDSAKAALADIEETLSDTYGDRLELGGTVMEKRLLREAIVSEIFLILVISVCLVALLMLITAASWIEPLVLLLSSGIAVLLNMGSNAIFGEISYITNAIASILQLALSIDYSIVLLHAYRHHKEDAESRESAMLMAIKEVVRPVSASALTTVAGLLALLFMSFTIGFDIGSVLMKSIVISAVTSLTLLPALLLIFDGAMEKTAKKPLIIRSEKLTNISLKAKAIIVPIALILVAVCCVLNFSSKYSFVDSCNKNEEITDRFGDSGTLIVLFENCEDAEEKEKLLHSLVESYRKEDGTGVLKGLVAYSTTVGQVFDVDKASRDLGISKEDANLLFTIYRFTEDESAVKMNLRSFCEFAVELIENDADALEYVSPETAKMLSSLMSLDEMLSGEYTASELHEAISDIALLEGLSIDGRIVDLVYGNMLWDKIPDQRARVIDLLSFISTHDLLDDEIKTQLVQLLGAYETVKSMDMNLPHPDMQVGLLELRQINQDLGFGADDLTITGLATKLGIAGSRKISFNQVFKYLIDNYIHLFPDEIISAMDSLGSRDYRYIYECKEMVETTFETKYNHDELAPALMALLKKLNRAPDIELNDMVSELAKQLYIVYFADQGMFPDERIACRDILNYALVVIEENAVVKELLPEDIKEKFKTAISDAENLFAFLNDSNVYTYTELLSAIKEYVETVKVMEVEVNLSETALMGLYVKYASAKGILETGEICATDLLAFVLDAADNNPLLQGRLDSEMKEIIGESSENMAGAEKLLRAEKYSRMLLTVTLPPEGAESAEFVRFLSAKVREIFGEGAYVAGEIATTNDLTVAFDADIKLISIFTVVSIFLIIMIVFGSLSLPVILVAVIQGAIWITMSLSGFGDPMFFMSYIMSMCILMGATIDYGILLSTNYVRARATLDRREALTEAMNGALPTIFTSGIILMVCGAVVGFIASQTSISSVGFLLFRGTLISALMVTVVLPALLYMLDKFVMGLTIKSKK